MHDHRVDDHVQGLGEPDRGVHLLAGTARHPPRQACAPVTCPRAPQVVALLILVFGVHVLSSTKDSPAGCAPGMRAILGRRPRKPDEYRLCVGDDDESKELCSALVEDEESRIGSPASPKSIS